MRGFALACFVLSASVLYGHDTWVETHSPVIRTGDALYIDLMLGNHGNDHRDFKFASKVNLSDCQFNVWAPDGTKYDLTPQAIDTGYSPSEGFWRSKFVATLPGLYLVEQTFDKVVNHGRPIRSIKSGKAISIASDSLDQVPKDFSGFDRVLGHPLELIAINNPVTPMGPGIPIEVQVLFKGQPLPEARISFIPRGATLAEGFDENFERKTDTEGRASFIPRTGNQYLIVVHHQSENERTEDYELTAYSATLTVHVPEICPCCSE